MSNPNPFDELRAKLADVETRTAARLIALEEENAFLTKENRELWEREHARQDADAAATMAAKSAPDQQG